MTDGGGGPAADCVIVAGGAGRRIGGAPKQFRPLGGRPMLAWSFARMTTHPEIDRVVVVVPAEVAADPPGWLSGHAAAVVAGGASRRASVHAGLRALAPRGPEDRPVLVHDAARPFVSARLVARLVAEAGRGPVIPVLRLADAVKRMRGRSDEATDAIESTLERDRLRAAQTPQAFPAGLLRRLHDAAAAGATEPPDDAALCEAEGIEVRTVPGSGGRSR